MKNESSQTPCANQKVPLILRLGKFVFVIVAVLCLINGFRYWSVYSKEKSDFISWKWEESQKTALIDGIDYSDNNDLMMANMRIYSSDLTEEEQHWLSSELMDRRIAVKEGRSYKVYPNPREVKVKENYLKDLSTKCTAWTIAGVVLFVIACTITKLFKSNKTNTQIITAMDNNNTNNSNRQELPFGFKLGRVLLGILTGICFGLAIFCYIHDGILECLVWTVAGGVFFIANTITALYKRYINDRNR